MKTFQKYPAVRYHKTLAAEGRVIKSADDEAGLGEGWVDTPAAFAPGYTALTADPPEGTAMDTVVLPSTPPEPYPAVRYTRDGRSVTVRSVVEDQALDPNEWKDTPDPKAWAAAPVAPPVLADPPPPSDPPPSASDVLFSTTVVVVEDMVSEITDIGALDALAAREATNPKGARIGVMKAITARLDALASATL